MSKKTNNKRIMFAKSKILEYPDLLEVQLKSFKDFFQLETTPENRKDEGLYQVFQEIFPIEDTRNNYKLEFIDYFIDPPQYSIEECLDRGLTYSVPLKAKLRLSCNDPEHEDFDTRVQDVYLGNIPYMTHAGTFVINGSERIIVSQLHRSPGVFFDQTMHANGTKLYSARIIPFKGSWIEFATDISNVMYAYIDRKKKLPVTTLLRAIGFSSDKDIINIFGLAEEVAVNKKNLQKNAGRKLAAKVLKTWTEDFEDEDTGEVIPIERTVPIVDRGEILDDDTIAKICDTDVKNILLQKDEANANEYAIIFNTLQKDPTNTEIEAVNYIYKQLRNSEPPDEATARDVIDKLFFSEKRYDLGNVGRYRLNKKLGLTTDPDVRVLTKNDIIEIIKYLIQLINSKATVDDIDHLSNRRVRTVGEQLANQFNVGLSRMARTIRERMNVRDSEQFNPIDLINAKTLSSVINSFFGTSQLSQFMDQTNPLAEITHKRRLSALGPGGLSRERAGFEVRDVHYTHYGRLCPIESPEGPNIGLISSLCVYARINDLGFIETPYREVHEGKVDLSDKGWHYMTAEEEEDKKVSLANVKMSDDGVIESDRIQCRLEADFPVVSKEEVDYMDVAPNQMASVAASLIPFLEHDDAHRALMGANMMRQAVPLLNPEAPIVGTGLEERVCLDSRTQVRAKGKGLVTYVDANEIRIKYDMTDDEKFVSFSPEETVYKLPIYRRTNQSTTITLKPTVRKGERVEEGQVLTEGYATQGGELALGRNLMVAFMPWKGYNYEDAVVISEDMVKWDILTSVHVDEFLTEVRGTKRGPEELTSDIPNVSEDATKNLDKQGIIRVGAHVDPGDIMIGKITPKGESDPSPEEKLLKAIFGDKAGDVKDASLKANPSLSGTVIKTDLYAKAAKETGRKGAKADQKAKLDAIQEDFDKKAAKLYADFIKRLSTLVKGKKSAGISDLYGVEIIPKGKEITAEKLKSIEYQNINSSKWTPDKDTNELIQELINNYCITYKELEAKTKRQLDMVKVGDELPNGVMQLAKVYVAKKRKITVGDKMAGRHGNKGCVAKIVRREDMPFLDDGTPVDIVLNPLGVPSRMNLGQIYETVLGWAGKKLGVKFSTPIFDGATNEEIDDYTKKAGLPRYGKTRLRDGGTGDWFDQSATVGVIYMLKLGHMVDDKMHARSIGPYSLITQQPLGGKAQFGGQRFGEMEVWALEAFGAANALQEILTVKSDDVTGRAKTYEAIVKGDPMPAPGIPESLNVLLHELRGLGLKVTLD
ncbi:MAG: DNA-directed RNA polymerase subunit beta [Bacteroidales bacterium]|nr:DNA-directed RNA polymerase subunit beta [Bacteroidales bacterium]MDY2934820.1 DNA-directed RNA polymerase subunit beta [Candidatus Cryptobacteroides sp.]MCI5718955.1 DNA-directed RNA polymerase subunit beta [Bacteroidales bacterium]MDD7088472.1 DNA-directed RNA polymerase subunit beta [Bacteroidales bacterium]MDY6377305.1 DNA-directed RNA polymerase subunit beta [Bacteroidales bacterium]